MGSGLLTHVSLPAAGTRVVGAQQIFSKIIRDPKNFGTTRSQQGEEVQATMGHQQDSDTCTPTSWPSPASQSQHGPCQP